MDGKAFSWVDFERALADIVYGPGNWFYDLEGCPTPNEEKEHLKEAMSSALPIEGNTTGRIIIFGTGGSMEEGEAAKDTFFKSSFRTVPSPSTFPGLFQKNQ